MQKYLLRTLTKTELQNPLRGEKAVLNQLKKDRATEAGLDSIRNRAMMMKESNEFPDVAAFLFLTLKSLGFLPEEAKAYFTLIDTVKKSAEVWMTDEDGKLVPEGYQPPPGQSRLLIRYYKQGNRKAPLFVHNYAGGALKEYLHFISAFPHAETDRTFRKIISAPPDRLLITEATFLHGALGIMTFEALAKETAEILIRFARVFDIIHTRFLDLKKAEAQTREALIEEAFELVRAKSMAMHKSEQLAETAEVLFEQFDLLGKIPDRMSIGIINEESRKVELWVTDQTGNQLNHEFFFRLDEPTSIAKIYKAWKEKKETIIVDLIGQNLQDWLRFVKEEAKLPVDETKIRGRRVQQAAFFSQGFLLFTTHEPVAYELMKLLVRFARVFDITYTRFRDLLKAEAQALEAIKASSLDRVRAEIASMRTPNDLQHITPLIWQELTVLGVPFVRCGVFIIDESNANEKVFLSAPDGHSLAQLNLPFKTNLLTEKLVEHWRRGTVYSEHWNKNEFLEWMQSMIDQGQIQNRENYQGTVKPPESLDLHFVPFKQGMIYVGNTNPLLQNEIDLVKSLSEAFSIAYARYEDFGRLEQAKQNVESALTELKATQAQLIQSEKMASLGELTAGIAHEIQNPLNFVNNFSEVNQELIAEMILENNEGNFDEANLIANDIADNEKKINYHGKRADAIVKGMLQHSTISAGNEEPTDVNALADEYLRFAYHGVRAKDKSFNAILKTDFDKTVGNINIVPQEIGRVMVNLYNNAFYAVAEKKKQLDNKYEPAVSVNTKRLNRSIEIRVTDNGNGIPQNILDKIFHPFFTTKPPGQGTGLGLSLSYDIVKAHGGKISVDTNEGGETQFIVELPV